MSLIYNLYRIFSKIIPVILFSFLFAPILLLVSVIIGKEFNFDTILNITQFVTIGSGTLAILTFTYAIVLEKGSEIYKTVVYIGELFFQSTLTFIIGVGLLIGVKTLLVNPNFYYTHFNNIYEKLGFVGEMLDALSSLIIIILLILGITTFIISTYFLSIGIGRLFELFMDNLSKEKMFLK